HHCVLNPNLQLSLQRLLEITIKIKIRIKSKMWSLILNPTAVRPDPLPWDLFSAVAVRTDGARRSRRFSVARTGGFYGKATSQGIAIAKRPEGRALSQILVGALNRFAAFQKWL